MHRIHRILHTLVLAPLVMADSCQVTTFSSSFDSATGRIEITIVFENGSAVHGGYTLLDGSAARTLDSGGMAVYEGVAEGDHALRLIGLPSQCTLEGENPLAVTVRGSETSMVRFSVRCPT